MAGRKRVWSARAPRCRPSTRRFSGETAPQLPARRASEKAGSSGGHQKVTVDDVPKEEYLQILQIQRRNPFSDAQEYQMHKPRRNLPPNPHPPPWRHEGEEKGPATTRSGTTASLFAEHPSDPPSTVVIHHGSRLKDEKDQVQAPLADAGEELETSTRSKTTKAQPKQDLQLLYTSPASLWPAAPVEEGRPTATALATLKGTRLVSVRQAG